MSGKPFNETRVYNYTGNIRKLYIAVQKAKYVYGHLLYYIEYFVALSLVLILYIYSTNRDGLVLISKRGSFYQTNTWDGVRVISSPLAFNLADLEYLLKRRT